MSAERDELALAMRQNFSGWMGPAVSYDVADAVIAAGYSKPRAILTIDELDALPVGSVVIDGGGAGEVYRKLARDEGVKWYEPSYTLHWESHELNFPAMVIWESRP